MGARFMFYEDVQNIYIMTTGKHPNKRQSGNQSSTVSLYWSLKFAL